MTEEEAKKKVCPQTFAIPDIRDGDGCGIRQGGPWLCVASECMAWRWHRAPGSTSHAHPDIGEALQRMKPERFTFTQMGTSPTGQLLDLDGEGFCGLAGKVS